MTFRDWFKPKSPASASPAAPKKRARMKISDALLARVASKPEPEKFELKRYEPAPGLGIGASRSSPAAARRSMYWASSVSCCSPRR